MTWRRGDGRTITAMSRHRPDLGVPRRSRPGVIDALLEGAGGLAQSVAVEVVPPVIDAVDIDAVLARVDINALLERVDLDALLERTELGSIVTRSASAVVSRSLDVVRQQGAGADALVERWTAKLLRRRPAP